MFPMFLSHGLHGELPRSTCQDPLQTKTGLQSHFCRNTLSARTQIVWPIKGDHAQLHSTDDMTQALEGSNPGLTEWNLKGTLEIQNMG